MFKFENLSVYSKAEGSSRTRKEFRRFLDIARGSCFEIVPLIDMAYKQKLLKENEKQEIYQQVLELSKMISGLKSSLK